MFALPVTLNFAGKEKIGTLFGSLISMLIFLLTLMYTFRMGTILVFKKDPKVSTSVSTNFFNLTEHHVWQTKSWKIAFGIENYDTGLANDDKEHVKWMVGLATVNHGVHTNRFLRSHKCTQSDFEEFYLP